MQASIEAIYPTPGFSYCYQRFTNRRLHYNWHKHPEMELIIVGQGRGQAHIGDRIADFHAPAAFLIGGDLAHGFASAGPIEGLILQFPPAHLAVYSAWPEGSAISTLLAEAERGIGFGKVASSLAGGALEDLDRASGFRRWLMILNMIADFSEDRERSASSRGAVSETTELRDFAGIVHAMFNESLGNVSLEAMSSRAGMSKSHFCRVFKRNTGLTYLEYVHSIRINNAKKLLIQTRLYIDDICYECGFNNVSFFNRKFKELTGMTPQQYKMTYAGHKSP
ncbi:MAG TPA: helix-turn-helix domain-containing protein [Rectinemataceae bacterium]|nr:helix-turn-helix domain-containing protein [Rectinemataceae bacterium]